VFSRAIAINVFLLRAALPIDAATLKGVVLANELSGPPMENIEVDAISGANHTESDSSGKFTLEFPQRQAGDTVRILVKKEGYVVVNDVQLQLALPADADWLRTIRKNSRLMLLRSGTCSGSWQSER
jgi:hypothetical protein